MYTKKDVLDESIVDITNIDEDCFYYGGFILMPSTTEYIWKTGRKSATTDAFHCRDVVPQSHGTVFEVLIYYGIHHNCEVLFY